MKHTVHRNSKNEMFGQIRDQIVCCTINNLTKETGNKDFMLFFGFRPVTYAIFVGRISTTGGPKNFTVSISKFDMYKNISEGKQVSMRLIVLLSK